MKLKEDIEHILAHTQSVWDELANKTIFITGGTGFFGKWLLESFVQANSSLSLNAKIIVLSRDPDLFLFKYPAFNNSSINFIKGDIKNFEFPEQHIDYIIHAGTDANTFVNRDNPLIIFETIVEGTKRVLELARIKKVKAILHTSSGAVYGKQPHDLTHIPENYPGSPDIYENNAAYGEGKRVSEMLCNFYYNCHGVNSKIARCFTFVGPYLPLDGPFAVGNFIKNLLTGKDIIVNGDGTPYRSYLYASDLTIWLWNILIFGKSCRPYNVGSDEDLTIEQLAHIISDYSKQKKVHIKITSPKINSFSQRYVPSIQRVKEELNLKVLVSLEDAINKTIKFHLGKEV